MIYIIRCGETELRCQNTLRKAAALGIEVEARRSGKTKIAGVFDTDENFVGYFKMRGTSVVRTTELPKED